MKPFILIALNAVVIGFFVWLSRKKNLLSSFSDGKWWLTWFSIAIITLLDKRTSIFYVPAESYTIVGVSTFVFIILTSILMRFLSNRMVVMAYIPELNNIKGALLLPKTFSEYNFVIEFNKGELKTENKP